jgi:hypothetical protein
MNLAMSTAKQQVESLVHKLPENCSLEDIHYHLYVLDKVRHGLEDARQQRTIPQEDGERRLSRFARQATCNMTHLTPLFARFSLQLL